MRMVMAMLALAFASGCTAPMIEKYYGTVVIQYNSATNVMNEVTIRKDYKGELKGSLK
jgi:uncharacterized protein HemY